MAAGKRIRCPYCQKVFLWKVKPLREDQNTVNMNCPYCREELVLKREMLVSGSS